MKRMTKLLAVLAVGAVATAGVVGLAACGEKGETYEGDYHYVANAGAENETTYGIKVNVTVTGDTIDSVEIADSNYVEVTDSWSDKALWNDGIEALLAKYKGLKVDDVLAIDVQVRSDGEDAKYPASGWQPAGCPVEDTVEGFVPFTVGETNLLIDGATQGSGRLLLAVQDALEKLDA